MNRWLGLILVLVLIAFGWYYFRTSFRYTPVWYQPKTAEVSRGDIRVPVTAPGLIEPLRDIEIKPEASGEVVEVRVEAGDSVQKGDVLVVLDPEDEKRSVERSKLEVSRLQAAKKQAELAVERNKLTVQQLDSQLQDLKARAEFLQFDYDRILERKEMGQYSQLELLQAKSQLYSNLAQQDGLAAQIATARVTVDESGEQVKLVEAQLEQAQKNLEDAEERLSETTIVSPSDGVVTAVYVETGNLVQSGTESFTGGTALLTVAEVTEKKVVARVNEADYGRVINISPLQALPQMPGLEAAAKEDAELLKKRTGRVKLTVDAFPDREFQGEIVRVEPAGKQNAGASVIQFDVHVRITDKDAYILPLGVQSQVEFTVESVEDALLVPSDAVKSLADEQGVWIATDPPAGSNEQWGKRFVRCKFGITDGASTQIVKVVDDVELKAGDKVYTKLPRDPEEM